MIVLNRWWALVGQRWLGVDICIRRGFDLLWNFFLIMPNSTLLKRILLILSRAPFAPYKLSKAIFAQLCHDDSIEIMYFKSSRIAGIDDEFTAANVSHKIGTRLRHD